MNTASHKEKEKTIGLYLRQIKEGRTEGVVVVGRVRTTWKTGIGKNNGDEKRRRMRKRRKWGERWKGGSETHLVVALGSLLVRDGLLLAHGGDDGDEEVLTVIEAGGDLLADVALGDLDVVLGVAVVVHEVEVTVVDVDLVLFKR